MRIRPFIEDKDYEYLKRLVLSRKMFQKMYFHIEMNYGADAV